VYRRYFIIITLTGGKTILMKYDGGARSPENVKALVLSSLDADKALEIESIDLRGQTALADYMVIASGTSSRHVGALAEKLSERLKTLGIKDVYMEGLENSDWVVVDAGDVVIHLFKPEVRSYYNLEKMWQTPHLANKQAIELVNA
jgi:ribosome-associated protein